MIQQPRIRPRRAVSSLALAALLVFAGCSSSDDGEQAGSTTTAAPTTTQAEVLDILVTNDDGVGADGLDAMVEALRQLPDTEVTVIAPLENKSGSGGEVTDGPLTVTDATTKSGYPAKAVAGFPADTVIWAFDQGGLAERPDVVLSGINAGQNVGPLVDISGTVGAARAAANRGVPALAASQGLAEPPDYPLGVEQVLSWLADHRAELLAGGFGTPAFVDNLNIPTCTTGEARGPEVLPVAASAGDINVFEVDCASTLTDPPDDVVAFVNGFIVLSEDIALEPATPTT